jgi:hypothetical protein
LFLTPSKAKSIVEQFAGAEPVLSQKGERKGQHVKYAYRFKYASNLIRHISISSSSTEDGVTVYVNKRSADNILYPEAELKPARVTKTYPMGFKGKTGDKGLSAAAAGLPTLDPGNNDVLKLSISSDDAFQRLLAWYFGKPAAKPMDIQDPQESTGSGSFLNGEPTESRSPISSKGLVAPVLDDEQHNSPVSANEQETLERDTPSLKTDEREAVVKVRFGQGGFRELLLNYKSHGEKCWMSGIEGKRLLIASHIKPWSHCKEEPDSRGNPDNGLLLSALWDTVFDTGLISFDADYKVVASSELSESARCALNLSEHTSLPEMFRTEGRKGYLAYHRAKVFESWNKAEPQTDLS